MDVQTVTQLKLGLKGFMAGALTGIVGVVLPFPFESYRLKVSET